MVDTSFNAVQTVKEKKESQLLGILKRLLENKPAMIGGIILLVLIILAILAPFLTPYHYAAMDPVNKYLNPCKEHLLGTDNYGRDMLTRLLYGARYSLALGFGASLISALIGSLLGAISGYFGGRLDYIVMRILDVFQSIPVILLTIVVSVALGPGLLNTIIAMGVAGIPAPARILRSSILSVRGQDYLEACIATNCSKSRIIFRHVLPNTVSSVIVNFTMGIGFTIMGAAGLSFIGLGIQPPEPEWGAMLVDAMPLMRHYPLLVVFPGLMISIVVLAVNLFGDGLRDAMDPKLKR